MGMDGGAASALTMGVQGNLVTRFAPTPSGYLHLGNAVNAQLVAWLAAGHGGVVGLRIDDMDVGRCRSEYVEDIFDVLAWLGIEWSAGPRDPADFAQHHSMRRRTGYYRSELALALSAGLDAYACACSRSRIRGPAVGGCPGGCRQADLPLEPGRTALRVHVPIGTIVRVSGSTVDLSSSMGDFVIWRRDDLPAYQLVSVIEDRDAHVTHVVRGDDLIDSTAAQLFLAPHLRAADLAGADFRHHGLLTDDAGAKLSKSQVVAGHPLPRTSENRTLIRQAASTLGEPLGIVPAG